MLSALREKSKLEISIVNDVFFSIYKHLDEHEQSKVTNIRQYAYASAVTRLYAILENFVGKILASYLDYLSENKAYNELSGNIKNEYRIGFSHVLSRIDQTRFKSLTHEGLIEKYHKAINNDGKYQFVSEALIRHDNNLRPSVIFELFGRLNMKELESWIVSQAKNISFYQESDKTREQFESELNNFIEIRNDSSHGVPEHIGSPNTIERNCSFIDFLVSTISAYLESEILSLLVENGSAFKLGKVTEIYTKANAAILKANANLLLDLDGWFYFKENSDFYRQKIQSIRLDGVEVSSFWIKQDDYEIGISCERLPRKNTEVFFIL